MGINFPRLPTKKGVKFVKISQIARKIGVILNFWNGHVLRLQIQSVHGDFYSCHINILMWTQSPIGSTPVEKLPSNRVHEIGKIHGYLQRGLANGKPDFRNKCQQK